MTRNEYENIQYGLSMALYHSPSNREDAYNNGILAAKSILKRFTLIYGFGNRFSKDEYAILEPILTRKLKSGRGRYDYMYNEAIDFTKKLLGVGGINGKTRYCGGAALY